MMERPLYIGTYTGNEPQSSKGIYRIFQNQETGKLTFDTLLAETVNPTFITFSPDRKFLYAVGETSKNGSVAAFAVTDEGNLRKLNEQPSLGAAPCHVITDLNQTLLFAANYTSGVLTGYEIQSDGSICEPSIHIEYKGSGPHPNQGNAHAHQTLLSPDGKFAYIQDLGSDRIHMYRIDQGKKNLIPLSPAEVVISSGSGPRHMVFHPNLPMAYLINELGNTVHALSYDKNSGLLSTVEIHSSLPEDYDEVSYGADIHISPDGHHLYASNRGHNSLVIFQIDSNDGSLSLIGFQDVHGDWPRNFYISPDGRFVHVANQRSNNISSFSRDSKTGLLTLIDSNFTEVGAPVCIID